MYTKDIEKTEQKLEELREQWKQASGVDRTVLKIRGQLLKMSLEGKQQSLYKPART